MSLMPQIKLLNTDCAPAAARVCFLKAFEFGFLMKLTGRRKTAFGSQSGTYLLAKKEMSGACGEMPLFKFYKLR